MTVHPLVPLGDFLALKRDEVVLDPTERYRIAGIYSWGRGLFERPPVLGAETSYRSLYRLTEGLLVVSRLNGWEGALDVVDKTFDGAMVSNEFPTFDVDRAQVDLAYLKHLCRWSALWDALVPRGSMVRRKRVNIGQLFSVRVPVPSLKVQCQVATRLDQICVCVAEMVDRSDRAASFAKALADTSSRELIQRGLESGWPLRPLSEVAGVNPRPASLDPEAAVAFVPMAAVDAASGSIVDATTRHVRDIGAGYKQFRRGDVIFARITPCMQNGKSAVFDEEADYGYGSTEFHVLRPGGEVLPRWLHTIVRTRDFRNAAAERFTGTAGQQRVPADFLKAELIPVPTRDIQAEVMATMAARRERFEQLDRSRARSQAVTAALMPAAMNQAFAELS